jgi:hypothetical protein
MRIAAKIKMAGLMPFSQKGFYIAELPLRVIAPPDQLTTIGQDTDTPAGLNKPWGSICILNQKTPHFQNYSS